MQEYPLKAFQEIIESSTKISTIRDTFLLRCFEMSGVDKGEDDAECFIGDDLVGI